MSDQLADWITGVGTGTQVGEYRVNGLLGTGGMARVYEAKGPGGNSVALKMVRADLIDDEIALRRFSLEAEVASTIRNPHLVSVLDRGVHDGTPYLVQELIDGSSLEQMLAERRRLDVQTALRICADVVEGLEALWDAGLVHRDVTPGNILIDRTGVAYLTDFGLVKTTNGGSLTRPGHTLGSLAYMAPEQIRCDPVTASADIYSLGCVMFTCLEGSPPFGDRTGARLLWAHLSDDPPAMTASADDLSPEFEAALKAAMRKHPADRPDSGAEYVCSMMEAARTMRVSAAG